MAWSSLNTLGSNQEKVTDAAIVLALAAAAQVGNVVVVKVASKPTTAASNSETTNITITDSVGGNTWERAKEAEKLDGTDGGDGPGVAIFFCKIAVEIPAAGTITAAYSDALRSAKTISAWEFSVGAGSTISVVGSAVIYNDGATDPAAITISGLPSGEYLWVHALGREGEEGAGGDFTYTEDADYTPFTKATTAGGSEKANIALVGGFRIFTGTTDTVDIATSADNDSVHVYVALKEATSQEDLTPSDTLTVEQDADSVSVQENVTASDTLTVEQDADAISAVAEVTARTDTLTVEQDADAISAILEIIAVVDTLTVEQDADVLTVLDFEVVAVSDTLTVEQDADAIVLPIEEIMAIADSLTVEQDADTYAGEITVDDTLTVTIIEQITEILEAAAIADTLTVEQDADAAAVVENEFIEVSDTWTVELDADSLDAPQEGLAVADSLTVEQDADTAVSPIEELLALVDSLTVLGAADSILGAISEVMALTDIFTIEQDADSILASILEAFALVDTWTIETDVETGLTYIEGSTSTANPPLLITRWGVNDTLWLAFAMAVKDITAAPTDFTNLINTDAFTSMLGSARRSLAAASLDPSGMTLSGDSDWVAMTVGIRLPTGVIPAITGGPSSVQVDYTGQVLTGTNFKAAQGTYGKVYLADDSDFLTANKVEQSITSWADTSITFSIVPENFRTGVYYFFVVNDDGNVSTSRVTTIAPKLIEAVSGVKLVTLP